LSGERSANVTLLLMEWSNGNRAALDELLPLVYAELRRRARYYMRAENPGHTLQPTALVHDAYLRLVDQEGANWQNRAHFFAVASQVIRHILVDHARSRDRVKRGGAALRVTWVDDLSVSKPEEIDLVGLDDALSRLTQLDERQSRIVELRFFGGLSIEETAEALKISPATVKREWTMARAWLYRELIGSDR
jgi:RNA polymerase sigma factor (TIGR02999 family)